MFQKQIREYEAEIVSSESALENAVTVRKVTVIIWNTQKQMYLNSRPQLESSTTCMSSILSSKSMQLFTQKAKGD